MKISIRMCKALKYMALKTFHFLIILFHLKMLYIYLYINMYKMDWILFPLDI